MEKSYLKDRPICCSIRFAALFIVHKNLKQVKALLKFFDHFEVECFVHIDNKYGVSSVSEETVELKYQKNVHVISEHFSGTLSDWSLIRITMALIEEMNKYELQTNISFDYIGLFSGQDYPIKTWRQFYESLEKNYPMPYIEISKYGENGIVDMFNKIRYWKIQNFLYTYIKRDAIRNILKLPIYLLEKIISSLFGSPTKKLKRLGIDIYQGSAWWIIDGETINWILEQYRVEGRYIKVIKNTSTPEEHFFQTMCMMSPYKERFRIGDNKHIYCNFSPQGRRITGHPYDITLEDLENGNAEWMKNPFIFFARKFDSETDRDAINWIDANILTNKLEAHD